MDDRREKILFVITKSNWGGAQRYVFDLAVSLKDTYDVVVALGGDGRLQEMLEAQSIETISMPHLKRDISLKAELHAFGDLYRMIREVRPDILHLNSSKAGGLGALAGRFARVKKIVFTAHAWAWNEDRSLLSRIAIAFLHFTTVLLAHRTICVSHAIYDAMARFPFTKRRMRVVHLGITPTPRIPREQARNYLAERMPALQDALVGTWIATVGELHPIKGHRYMLKALTELRRTHPDLHYLIIGEGDLRRELEATVAKLDLEEVVHFFGHIDDVSALFPAFDILAVPSLSESFGYVVVEAGAADIPVVASKVGGIPEIIGEDMGLLVPPENPKALTEALEIMLKDPHQRGMHAHTLHARVLSYFTRTRMVEETKDVYMLMG